MEQNELIPVNENITISERLQSMLNQFQYFGLGCILYGLIFTLCLYKGFHGITVPILSLLTMGMLSWFLRLLEIPMKKSDIFYFAAWEILAISNCLTGSGVLIFFNVCGMSLLLFSFLLTHFCNTKTWGFGKYFAEIFAGIFAPWAYVAYPFQSLKQYRKGKETTKSKTAQYIGLGILISIPLLIVIMGLLSSADVVFRNLFSDLFANIQLPERPFHLGYLIFTGMIGSYSLIAYMANEKICENVPEKKKWEPIIGITFLTIITLVYLIFSVIQVSYLFLGNFALPEGYSYATYAREGFFQLLFVCLINLAIILICISRFRENLALKIILTIFSGCTYIMIASSAMRMLLYIKEYELTFLRVLVLWSLAVIGILLIACIATIYNSQFPLFQYTMVTVAICYLIFSLAKPDYLIAKYNLASGKENADIYYLLELSSDAIPALEEADMLKEVFSNGPMYPVEEQYRTYEEMGVLDFNFSYKRAYNILNKYQ